MSEVANCSETYKKPSCHTTENSNCQKNLSSANEKICDAKKPVATAAVAATDKNSSELSSKPSEALIPLEPIHYHLLPSKVLVISRHHLFGKTSEYIKGIENADLTKLTQLIKIVGMLLQTKVHLFWFSSH
jgi:hypothetical protein